jgi:hypothetical protein
MRLSTSDQEILRRAAQLPSFDLSPQYQANGFVTDPNVGLGAISRWYFGGADLGKGMTPLYKQWILHHAPHRNITMVGGIGCAKTSGVALSAVAWCITTPFFAFTNAAPVSAQAQLLYDFLAARIELFPTLQRHIKDMVLRPYPKITFQNGSVIDCRTAGIEGANLRGIERDWINYDECGFDPRLEATRIALTGRLRGNRPNHVPRLNRLTFVTSPTDEPFLRELWDRGADRDHPRYNPETYLSLRATIYENIYLSEQDILSIQEDLSDEQRRVELLGEFPEGTGEIFPRAQVAKICDPELNNIAQGVKTKDGEENWGSSPVGYRILESRYHGVVHYQKPYDPSGLYVLAGDPGAGKPPHRNAGVVVVLRIDVFPHEIYYFDWVDGQGKYAPFLASFRYAMEQYQPAVQGIDATGPQMGLNELAFEAFGINVDGIRFNRDKGAMLSSLQVLIQREGLRSPVIKGLRTQLQSYIVPDNDITQDIVCALMMAAYLARYAGADMEDNGSWSRDSRSGGVANRVTRHRTLIQHAARRRGRA